MKPPLGNIESSEKVNVYTALSAKFSGLSIMMSFSLVSRPVVAVKLYSTVYVSTT